MSNGQVNESMLTLRSSERNSALREAETLKTRLRALEAGVVWVNCFGDGDMTQPFGGYKQSGNTRDKSMECLEGYLQSKSAWISLS